MGICQAKGISPAEAARDAEIAAKLAKDREEEGEIIKILLLGAGESGKSTLLKQMRELYGKRITEEERKRMRGIVHGNIVAALAALVNYCDDNDYVFEEAADEANDFRATFMEEIDPEELATVQIVYGVNLDEQRGEMLERLWNDPAVVRAFAERANFQVSESIK